MTFDYFGVIIRVNPTASDLDLVGFILEAADVETVDENKAMQATARYLKGLVHPDDWDTFWRQAKANRQILPDLLLLGEKIVEAVAGIPTEPPADSSGGRPTTSSTSKVTSSSRKAPRKASSSRAAETKRALELVPPERADIKEFLVMAAENRDANALTTMTAADRMALGLSG
jgi:hypothetical protein